MAYLCGAVGFVIVFFMLRRNGSVGRHILAFFVGMIVSLFLYGMYVASIIPPGGAYRSDWLAWVWLVGIVISFLLQVAAMVAALIVRRRHRAKATAMPSA
jgi:multisubunit Na+/H+ antiporter MnhE subunit